MTFNAFKSFFVHIIFDSFLFEEVVLFNKEYVLGWARNELIAQTLVFITLKHFLKAEKLIRVREVAALIDVCFGVVVIILFRLVNNMVGGLGDEVAMILGFEGPADVVEAQVAIAQELLEPADREEYASPMANHDDLLLQRAPEPSDDPTPETEDGERALPRKPAKRCGPTRSSGSSGAAPSGTPRARGSSAPTW